MHFSVQQCGYAMAVFLGSVAALIGLLWLSPRLGWIKRPNARSLHGTAVPWTGGVPLIAALVLGLLVSPQIANAGSLAAYLVLAFVIGWLDDLRTLTPWPKLLLQGLSLVLVLLQLDGLEQIHPGASASPWAGPSALVVVLGCVIFLQNAVNFLDGVDGLAGMYAMFVVLVLAWAEWKLGSPRALVHGWLAIALTAFLLFNLSAHRKMFLGNSGSLLLGAWCSLSAILLLERLDPLVPPRSAGFLLLLVLFLLPIADTLRVFWIRARRGAKLLEGDKNHIHHALVQRGWSHFRVSSTLVGLAALFFAAAVGLLAL